MSLDIYSYFSPEETIRKYFEEFAGSLQNKSHYKALEYSEKVESLRNLSCSYFKLSNTHLVSFQFNQHYIEKIIFQYLKINNSWTIYTDEPNKKIFKKLFKIYSLKALNKAHELNSKTLIWVSAVKKINLSLLRKIKQLNKKRKKNFYSFLSLDSYLYSSPSLRFLLKGFSFYSFNPSRMLQEYGTVLFFFKKRLHISPVFMGSNASLVESNNLKLEKLPVSLEIGTQNLISLIVLERFFYFLSKNYTEISDKIISLEHNFNFKDNLKTK